VPSWRLWTLQVASRSSNLGSLKRRVETRFFLAFLAFGTNYFVGVFSGETLEGSSIIG